MTASPSLEVVQELVRDGRRVIPVYRRLMADTLTPVATYQKLCGERENTFLLESATPGERSRWSFIGVRVPSILTVDDGSATWVGEPLNDVAQDPNPLAALATVLAEFHTEPVLDSGELPPFTSGMVGFLGYDVVRRIERLPDSNNNEQPDVPEMEMWLAADVAAYDHLRHEIWLISNVINFDNSDEGLAEAYARAATHIEDMVDELSRPADVPDLVDHGDITPLDLDHRTTPERYQEIVRECVEEIRAGEAYQIVPSQRFDVQTSATDIDIYRELRATNPSPYMYLLRGASYSIVGSSPEALVTVFDRQATIHPIAGSRPRTMDEMVNQRREEDLLADEKERSEHVMLVDLARNDLGRVCVPGTVAVTEFMDVRHYSHIMHIESTVTGTIADGVNALDATMAGFPAGTLSGAPKLRAMEIIDAMETSRRGVYSGAVGYFDFAGNADTAIAIRTAVMANGIVSLRAGAGVVVDSDPLTEHNECLAKIGAVKAAIERAEARKTP